MPELVVRQHLVPLEVASTRTQRRRGLLGRDGIDGALLLERTRSVHTVGMKFAIDVAHLDDGGGVLAITTMVPGRVGRFVWGARSVLEAEAGAFDHWGLAVGDRLTIVADRGQAEEAA